MLLLFCSFLFAHSSVLDEKTYSQLIFIQLKNSWFLNFFFFFFLLSDLKFFKIVSLEDRFLLCV